jgi:hypothetical protein
MVYHGYGTVPNVAVRYLVPCSNWLTKKQTQKERRSTSMQRNCSTTQIGDTLVIRNSFGSGSILTLAKVTGMQANADRWPDNRPTTSTFRYMIGNNYRYLWWKSQTKLNTIVRIDYRTCRCLTRFRRDPHRIPSSHRCPASCNQRSAVLYIPRYQAIIAIFITWSVECVGYITQPPSLPAESWHNSLAISHLSTDRSNLSQGSLLCITRSL